MTFVPSLAPSCFFISSEAVFTAALTLGLSDCLTHSASLTALRFLIFGPRTPSFALSTHPAQKGWSLSALHGHTTVAQQCRMALWVVPEPPWQTTTSILGKSQLCGALLIRIESELSNVLDFL